MPDNVPESPFEYKDASPVATDPSEATENTGPRWSRRSLIGAGLGVAALGFAGGQLAQPQVSTDTTVDEKVAFLLRQNRGSVGNALIDASNRQAWPVADKLVARYVETGERILETSETPVDWVSPILFWADAYRKANSPNDLSGADLHILRIVFHSGRRFNNLEAVIFASSQAWDLVGLNRIFIEPWNIAKEVFTTLSDMGGSSAYIRVCQLGLWILEENHYDGTSWSDVYADVLEFMNRAAERGEIGASFNKAITLSKLSELRLVDTSLMNAALAAWDAFARNPGDSPTAQSVGATKLATREKMKIYFHHGVLDPANYTKAQSLFAPICDPSDMSDVYWMGEILLQQAVLSPSQIDRSFIDPALELTNGLPASSLSERASDIEKFRSQSSPPYLDWTRFQQSLKLQQEPLPMPTATATATRPTSLAPSRAATSPMSLA